MVSVDVYVNETTRHADVILPAPSPLYRSHYDLALYQLAARNIANYSPAVLEPGPIQMPEWQTLLRLAGIVAGQGPDADVEAFDDLVIGGLVARELQDPASPLAGRDAAGAARPRWPSAAAPSACSTGCCARAPTATASVTIPTG